jgi:tetrahydromethanopterin S-methyltransferase subunit G
VTLPEKDKLVELSEKMDDFKDSHEKLSKDIVAIKEALLGGEYNVNGGIVKRLENIEAWKETVKLRQFTQETTWDIIKSWGAFIGAIIAILYEIVTAFFKK